MGHRLTSLFALRLKIAALGIGGDQQAIMTQREELEQVILARGWWYRCSAQTEALATRGIKQKVTYSEIARGSGASHNLSSGPT